MLSQTPKPTREVFRRIGYGNRRLSPEFGFNNPSLNPRSISSSCTSASPTGTRLPITSSNSGRGPCSSWPGRSAGMGCLLPWPVLPGQDVEAVELALRLGLGGGAGHVLDGIAAGGLLYGPRSRTSSHSRPTGRPAVLVVIGGRLL